MMQRHLQEQTKNFSLEKLRRASRVLFGFILVAFICSKGAAKSFLQDLSPPLSLIVSSSISLKSTSKLSCSARESLSLHHRSLSSRERRSSSIGASFARPWFRPLSYALTKLAASSSFSARSTGSPSFSSSFFFSRRSRSGCGKSKQSRNSHVGITSGVGGYQYAHTVAATGSGGRGEANVNMEDGKLSADDRFDAFRALRLSSKRGHSEKFERQLQRLRGLPNLSPRECSILVRAAAEMNRPKLAIEIFHQAINAGAASTELFNSAISSQRFSASWKIGINLFMQMPQRNVKRDVVTYNTLISVLARSHKWRLALEVTRELVDRRKGVSSLSSSQSGDDGARSPLRGLVAEIRGSDPDIQADDVTFNAGIYAARVGRKSDKAIELLSEMQDVGMQPDTVSFSSVISALRGPNAWSTALLLLEDMKRLGVGRNTITYNAIIKTAAQASNWHLAFTLLEDMRQDKVVPDVISYNTVIHACEQQARVDKALEVFNEMEKASVLPNTITYNTAISVCEKAGNLDTALSLFEQMKAPNANSAHPVAPVNRDEITFNALISTCEKAGDWQLALSMLDQMRVDHIPRSTVTFNAAISACQKAGKWQQALALLFTDMPAENVAPSTITFNAAISACGAAGEWRTALALFQRVRELEETARAATEVRGMRRKGGQAQKRLPSNRIRRDSFTYSSIINALGVSGELDLAFSLFEEYRAMCSPSLQSYGRDKDKGRARKNYPSIVVYNTIAAGCERDGTGRGAAYAERVWQAIKDDEVEPEVYTIGTLVSALERGEDTRDLLLALESELEDRVSSAPSGT